EDPITASASNSVNLFQPSAKMTLTTNPTTATSLGQPITYTYTVSNTSSSDSPNLVLDTSNPNNSFTDTLLTTAAGYNLEADALTNGLVFLDTNKNAVLDPGETVLGTGFTSLAPGQAFQLTETRAIQAGDKTPLINTATVSFTLAQNLGNFSNIITA